MIIYIIASLVILSIGLWGIFRSENTILLLIYIKLIFGAAFIALFGISSDSVVVHQSNLINIFPVMTSAIFFIGAAICWQYQKSFKSIETGAGSEEL